MKTRKALYVGVVLFAVAASVVLLAAARSHARGGTSPIVVEGTGKFDSQVVRTSDPLDPPCVSHVTRVGQVAFTGFISNAFEDGRFEAHALRDACAGPVQGTSRQTYDLLNATVAGRTGHLRIEAEGTFEGDATTPPGARTRYLFKIQGIGGDFAGAEGEGQSVGLTTASRRSGHLVQQRLRQDPFRQRGAPGRHGATRHCLRKPPEKIS